MNLHNHPHGDGCGCAGKGSSVSQTLDELDFERGIWSAANSGNLQRVRQLLAKHRDVDRRDPSGFTALHYAARSGHVDVVKELLLNGADVNAQTPELRSTPLHRAAAQGQIAVIDILLSHGADKSLRDTDGRTYQDILNNVAASIKS